MFDGTGSEYELTARDLPTEEPQTPTTNLQVRAIAQHGIYESLKGFFCILE